MSARDAERTRRAATLTVLREADQILEGWSCEGSTECCRFGITGREPWMTEAEWALLAAEIARGGRKPPAPREDGVCALLSAEGRCTVYEARPFGCRTFYCERARGPGAFPRRALGELPRRLDALSQAPADGDRGARPLTSWLRSAGRAVVRR